MSDPLSREAVAAVDPAGMVEDVLDQPHQALDAVRRAQSAGLPELDCPGGLVVCGMGGSAIGGELAAAIVGPRAVRPIRVSRGYEVPLGTGPDTLVLAASYSGNTEETLAAFEAAGEAGAPRVALATHGKLAEAARDAGVPVIGVPSGMQPRAAVHYMTVGALMCAAACRAAPSPADEVEASVPGLAALAGEWGPGSAEDSQGKRMALALREGVPVIYGAAATGPVARRWKTQVNENAKRPAFAAVLPEAAHNEICGWTSPGGFAGVFLEEAGVPGRLGRRMRAMRDLLEEAGSPTIGAEAQGSSPFERVMSLVLLGDLVSVYLATLAGVDPTPIDLLERLKNASL
jgi:glucose/mannose-6-phosphate isomerase